MSFTNKLTESLNKRLINEDSPLEYASRGVVSNGVNKKSVVSTLKQFASAYNTLCEYWYSDMGDVIEDACQSSFDKDGIPPFFAKSFDELGISEWCQSMIENIK